MIQKRDDKILGDCLPQESFNTILCPTCTSHPSAPRTVGKHPIELGHGYVPVEKLIINFSSPGSGGGGGGVVGMGDSVGVGGASGCVGVGVGAGASEGGASVCGVVAASVGRG